MRRSDRQGLGNAVGIAALCVIALGVVSCGFGKDWDEARKVAEAGFQERIREGGLCPDEWYSDLFWKNIDEREWVDVGSLVKHALGDLKSYSLLSAKVEERKALGQPSGTFVVLAYKTVYEKGKGIETLIMYSPNRSADFLISFHGFNSPEITRIVAAGVNRGATSDE
jgi:hypothetical protein